MGFPREDALKPVGSFRWSADLGHDDHLLLSLTPLYAPRNIGNRSMVRHSEDG